MRLVRFIRFVMATIISLQGFLPASACPCDEMNSASSHQTAPTPPTPCDTDATTQVCAAVGCAGVVVELCASRAKAAAIVHGGAFVHVTLVQSPLNAAPEVPPPRA